MSPEFIALVGVLASSAISAAVAVFVARKSAEKEQSARQMQMEIEFSKINQSLKKDKTDRKLELSYKYAELKKLDESTAISFFQEFAKETAIGFLYIDDDNQKSKIWIRDNSNILLGRRDSCDIVLDSIYISREHCIFHTQDEELFLIPLNPTNPIKLDSKEIHGKAVVKHEAIIDLHPYRFKYFAFRSN